MKIGKFKISNNHIFIIAEIGNNHNGDIGKAFKMIDMAIEMGANCVKFQMRQINKLYRSKSLKRSGDDLGTEYILDLLEKFELTIDEHKLLSEYCENKDIIYMCTPWDEVSVDILESFNVHAYKVSSADLTNIPLIKKLCSTNKPLILSTGMSSLEEIKFTVDFLNHKKAEFALLHCNSTYPAPIHDINLQWMSKLKEIHPRIGYSGHERGINVSLAAAALGAKILERHFTLDRGMEGPDHAASLEFNEFKNLILGCREIKEAMGIENSNRVISQGEMINRENLSKSLVSSKDLTKGHIITKDDIMVLSPGMGLSPQMLGKLIGRSLKRDMMAEDYFFISDISDINSEPKDYSFKLKWGVPVRFHDFKEYEKKISPDIYEFHLSYKDMDLQINNFLDSKYKSGFIVHAPELFKNSHLMDLASEDESYRKISIKETQRVIDLTIRINEFFPSQTKPLIVANIGGFSMDKPIPQEEKHKYYERFYESLDMLKKDKVEIIPQTMAPFPWHFGGQRLQNLFVTPDEIIENCKKHKIRICLDVSHSMLTCNHLNLNFYDFVEEILPYTAHIHMGDAKGVNGEGLQVGEGEIDFDRLCKILINGSTDLSFIPEIWQGHKNHGEGFWTALSKLEKKL